MDVWVGQRYQPDNAHPHLFNLFHFLCYLFLPLCCLWTVPTGTMSMQWSCNQQKELLCLKHHPAKSSISAFSWPDLVSSPLYKDSVHSYVTHKNGWSTVLLKYHKPMLAQIAVQVDSWIVKKRRALQRSYNQSRRTCNRQLQNGTSQNPLEKLPRATVAESIVSIHRIGKWMA